MPVADSTSGDAALTCAGFEAEFNSVRWETLSRYAELTSVQRANVAFLSLAVLDPMMLAGLSSSNAAEAELAAYRRRYDTLVEQWERRPCQGIPVAFPAPGDIDKIIAEREKSDDAAIRGQIASFQGRWRGRGAPAAATDGGAIDDCLFLEFVVKVRGQTVAGHAQDKEAGRRLNISGFIHPNGDLWEARIGSFPLNGSLRQGVYHVDGCMGEYRWKQDQ